MLRLGSNKSLAAFRSSLDFSAFAKGPASRISRAPSFALRDGNEQRTRKIGNVRNGRESAVAFDGVDRDQSGLPLVARRKLMAETGPTP